MPMSSTINVHAANAVIGLKKQRNPKTAGNIWRQNLTTKPLLNTTECYTIKPYTASMEKSESAGDHQQSCDPNANAKGEITETDSKSQSSLTLSLPNQSELLPIAEEEKDSPGTSSKLDNEPELDAKTKADAEKQSECGNLSQ